MALFDTAYREKFEIGNKIHSRREKKKDLAGEKNNIVVRFIISALQIQP
jgi:hypothetical protein